MNKKYFIIFALLVGGALVAAPGVFAKSNKSDLEPQGKGNVHCTMAFELHSWSVFYKSGKGKGTITCSNGQKANIKISTHGGGITFGKFNIANGKGKFSPVHNIKELYGKYANVGGEGGASKARMGANLSKDDISLGIEGTGSGGGFGFDFSGFRISPL
jgi:hypothetical protein